MTAVERARRLFTQRFGTAPTGVWSAPGRANLIGEHTDYNDGYVLPFAIPHRLAVAAQVVDDEDWVVWSENTEEAVTLRSEDLQPGRVEGWAAYVAGVLWVLRENGHQPPPARLVIASDVPDGAGLSSSAALECAVLAALVDLDGLDVPRDAWPRLAQRAENAYVGMPCGIMDQAAVTLCREGHALFLDCRSLAVEHVPFNLAGHGLAMLVIDTRAPHQHVSGEYASRRQACERAAETIGVSALRDIEVDALAKVLTGLDDVTARRVRHVVTEDARVLDTVAMLRTGAIADIGPLLDASHTSMRDDYEITVPEVDTAVRAARAAGSHGARMTGGGFGGCVLALVNADQVAEVGRAVEAAFAAAGFTAPHWFAATPAGGVTAHK